MLVLGYLLRGAVSIQLKCEAPLTHPDPVSGARLKSFSLITRHGHRTPLNDWLPTEKAGYWYCDSDDASSPRMDSSKSGQFTRRFKYSMGSEKLKFPPSCNPGDLTVQGMKQHTELGKFYRDYLVNELHFLPFNMDKKLLNLRASYFERTIASAQSFLGTFYPPAAPGETVDIATGNPNHEPLYTEQSQCEYMSRSYEKFANSDAFHQRMARSIQLYDPLFEALNLTADTTNWMFIGDWLTSYLCAGQDVPNVDLEAIYEQSQKDIAYYSAGLYQYMPRGVAGSQVWRLLLKNINKQLAKETDSIFHYYSGHDITIEAVLYTLGWTTEKLPTFRSHCSIEIWENDKGVDMIRVVLNGEVIQLKEDGTKLMQYSDFKSMISSYLSYCLEEFPQ